MRTLDDWPLAPRIAQVFYGLVFYAWKTLWPTRLCALYELRHGLNPFAPTYLLCYGIVLAAGAATLLLARRAPWLAAAAGIYAISVAPVLGLFQSGDQFVADRYSYIACMSWSALAAGGVLALSRRFPVPRRAWAFAGPVLAATVLVRLTLVQIPTWTDAVTLWRQACQADPIQLVPHVNYALSLEVRARQLQQDGHADDARRLYDEALEQYRTATRINPQDGRGWFPMGNALKRDGDRAGAEAAFREAAKYLPQAYLPLVNLGYLLEQDPSRRDEALAAFRQAVDSVEHPRPGSAPSAKPYLALGLALKNRADIPGARDAFTRGLAMAQKLEDEVSIQQARGQLAALGIGR
jgi:tetratricopeptide (TPR) repeat protein